MESIRHPYESTMKYPGDKNEIFIESTRHPMKATMKYPRGQE